MRCLALSQAWIDAGGTVTFVLGADALVFSSPLQREGIPVVPADWPLGSKEDGMATARLAKARRASWIVVDGYSFGETFQTSTRSNGVHLLVIDDDARIGRYASDIIVDQNDDVDVKHYADTSGPSQILRGAQFALLRREFRLSSVPDSAPIRRPPRLLITLGGSDPDDASGRLIDLTARLQTRFEITLVVGRAAKPPTAAAGTRLLMGVENMAALMAETDVAIATGGTTAWELAAMGVPALLGRIADNQDAVIRTLARHGAAIDVGWFDGTLDRELEALATDPSRMEAMRGAGLRLVNRNGASNVVGKMLSFEAKTRHR
jgi:spore coat polysaccharide biosynthesis predicted glycosyltransferase SpsG